MPSLHDLHLGDLAVQYQTRDATGKQRTLTPAHMPAPGTPASIQVHAPTIGACRKNVKQCRGTQLCSRSHHPMRGARSMARSHHVYIGRRRARLRLRGTPAGCLAPPQSTHCEAQYIVPTDRCRHTAQVCRYHDATTPPGQQDHQARLHSIPGACHICHGCCDIDIVLNEAQTAVLPAHPGVWGTQTVRPGDGRRARSSSTRERLRGLDRYAGHRAANVSPPRTSMGGPTPVAEDFTYNMGVLATPASQDIWAELAPQASTEKNGTSCGCRRHATSRLAGCEMYGVGAARMGTSTYSQCGASERIAP